MTLENLLTQKRNTIIDKWFNLTIDSYPSGSSKFLKKGKDKFHNPVGYNISSGIEIMYDELLSAMDTDRLYLALDRIIRIRSVQDFSSSEAVAFIFQLKKVIREELATEAWEGGIYEELLAFESKIDRLALFGFDIYMKCREKIYEIKADEVKRRTYRLAERANRIDTIPRHGGGLEDDKI